MKIVFSRCVFLFAVVVLSHELAGAITHAWTVHEGDPHNVFTNELHFSTPLGVIPAADNVVAKSSSGELKLTMPEGADFASTLAPVLADIVRKLGTKIIVR